MTGRMTGCMMGCMTDGPAGWPTAGAPAGWPKCVACKEPFFSLNVRHIYCRACRLRRYRPPRAGVRPCGYCFRPLAYTADESLCSDECRAAVGRNRVRRANARRRKRLAEKLKQAEGVACAPGSAS